ncbi:MAG: NYN domain-containing protein, partial [Paracoccaceae bacterium]|nr:NYN domain-containing protein [Paracoccaceae bacterium]
DDGETPDWIAEFQSQSSCILRTGRLVQTEKRTKQEGVDVRLAIEALQQAHRGNIVSCWIFSGDGDLIPLVDALVDTGVFVTVATFRNPGKGTVVPLLRDKADNFEWLNSLSIWNLALDREHGPIHITNDEVARANGNSDIEPVRVGTQEIKKHLINKKIVIQFKHVSGSIQTMGFNNETGLDLWLRLVAPKIIFQG